MSCGVENIARVVENPNSLRTKGMVESRMIG